MRIDLEIDELVLEGHDAHRRRAAGDAISATLASPSAAWELGHAIRSWGEAPVPGGRRDPWDRRDESDLGPSAVRAVGIALAAVRQPAKRDGAP